MVKKVVEVTIVLVISSFLIVASIVSFISVYNDNKKHIVGYQLDKMISAKDGSVSYDTTGTIYKKGDSVFLIEKPYSEYK